VLSVLVHVLDTVLRLLHPVAPHVTEEMWEAMHEALATPGDRRRSLMVAPFPEPDPARVNGVAESRVAFMMEVVRGIRNLRAEFGVAPGIRLAACASPTDREHGLVLGDNGHAIAGLARLTDLGIVDSRPVHDGAWASFATAGAEVFLDIGAALDVDRERERLDRDVAATEAEMDRLRARLSDEQFIARAPEAVVAKQRAALEQLAQKLGRLGAKREALASLGTR
jgi:valyl-tRNA synthetase